ncbi:MAG: lipocalin family protein [Bacteroidales bacterium]|jgi:hypothetical protein|nr:lipocalin family protein [Bacteroidales bacterium]
MKKNFRIRASVLMIAAFAAVCVSCEKEEGNDLIGRWLFHRSNVIYYFEGQPYNLKEEGDGTILSELNRDFRNMIFMFESDGSFFGGVNEQLYPSGTYSVSGDKITIKDGSNIVTINYRLSGNMLDLTFSDASFELVETSLPDELFDIVDDFEMILTFIKTD